MDPDIVVISTSPHAHLEYARQTAAAGIHVFTEFSWTENLAELDALDALCAQRGVVGAPSCTQRFQDSVVTLRDLVRSEAVGKVVFLSYHSGQWAPDWHPWEPITDFYLGHKAMGGGREQVSFELDWIRWIMGSVTSVTGLARKLTTLPADIDDLYQITLAFGSGAIASVTVDMIQRCPNRTCVFLTERGQIVWDYVGGLVRVYSADKRSWQEYRESEGNSGYFSEGHTYDEPLYRNELSAFLEAVRGKTAFPNRYRDERSLLEIVHTVERSSADGRTILLDQAFVS